MHFMPRSMVTDMEVSAFSECFLLLCFTAIHPDATVKKNVDDDETFVRAANDNNDNDEDENSDENVNDRSVEVLEDFFSLFYPRTRTKAQLVRMLIC